MEIRSQKTKEEFIAYLTAHPEQRFWQSVRNFSGYPFILASSTPLSSGEGYSVQDTFYWEDKNK